MSWINGNIRCIRVHFGLSANFFVFSASIPLIMEPGEFRKLNIDLPVDPITNDRPWSIAGWLFAFAFVILVAYAFLLYKGVL